MNAYAQIAHFLTDWLENRRTFQEVQQACCIAVDVLWMIPLITLIGAAERRSPWDQALWIAPFLFHGLPPRTLDAYLRAAASAGGPSQSFNETIESQIEEIMAAKRRLTS